GTAYVDCVERGVRLPEGWEFFAHRLRESGYRQDLPWGYAPARGYQPTIPWNDGMPLAKPELRGPRWPFTPSPSWGTPGAAPQPTLTRAMRLTEAEPGRPPRRRVRRPAAEGPRPPRRGAAFGPRGPGGAGGTGAAWVSPRPVTARTAGWAG